MAWQVKKNALWVFPFWHDIDAERLVKKTCCPGLSSAAPSRDSFMEIVRRQDLKVLQAEGGSILSRCRIHTAKRPMTTCTGKYGSVRCRCMSALPRNQTGN